MPLIAVALIGAGAWAGYKFARHWLGEASPDASAKGHAGPSGETGAKDLGRLEYDAEAGVWRPAGKH